MRDLESLHEQQEPIGQIVEGPDGHPLQTIPKVVMCDQAGHEVDVLRWTGRTSTPQSIEAGRQNIARMIREDGAMLRGACPLSAEFGAPAVKAEPGEAPCKGIDEQVGCKHYRAEAKRRRDVHETKERADAEAHASPTQAMHKIAESLSKHFEREASFRSPDPDVVAPPKRRPGV